MRNDNPRFKHLLTDPNLLKLPQGFRWETDVFGENPRMAIGYGYDMDQAVVVTFSVADSKEDRNVRPATCEDAAAPVVWATLTPDARYGLAGFAHFLRCHARVCGLNRDHAGMHEALERLEMAAIAQFQRACESARESREILALEALELKSFEYVRTP